MGWGINVNDLLKIKVRQPCLGYYLCWYYNGWHYWWFLPGKHHVLSTGEKYRTLGSTYLAMCSGQITPGQAQAIQTIEQTTEIYILTDIGWKALRIEHDSIIICDSKIAGTEIEFTAIVGTRQLTNTSGYSPVEYVPPPPPVNLVSGNGALYNWWTVQGVIPGFNKYNMFYNWYAVDDARNLANTGWHIPTGFEQIPSDEDWRILCRYIAPPYGSVCSDAMREVGTTYWIAPNAGATNSSGFSLRGTGIRNPFPLCTFISQYYVNYFWYSNPVIIGTVFTFDTTPNFGTAFIDRNGGASLRLVKDSTILSDGETGVYIGNDGKAYNTICIGTQEWLSENLSETKYRNGDTLPEVTDNAAWCALITGAYSYYNNIPL